MYPWQQYIPLLIFALLLLITLRATDHILTLFISQWHLGKKKKDRQAVVTIFLWWTDAHYSITVIFHVIIFHLVIFRDLYVWLK